jgi:hypothetical protein
MNYYQSFITVAPDSTATHATVPPVKGAAMSIPALEYELLSKHPYTYTQEELQFAVHVRRAGLSETEVKAKHTQLWAQFFSKPRACLRGSSLPKKYGWGLHFNNEGKIALVALESKDYEKFSHAKDLKIMPALKSKRA